MALIVVVLDGKLLSKGFEKFYACVCEAGVVGKLCSWMFSFVLEKS